MKKTDGKNSTMRLVLAKETLRTLTTKELPQVQGGWPTWTGCYNSCVGCGGSHPCNK
jgi:hypothetical protein